MSLIVLWEDSLQKETAPRMYGPHALLCACIADQLANEHRWYEIRASLDAFVTSVPMAGVSKLMGEVDVEALYAGGRHVIAVFDEDNAHRHPELELAARAALEARRTLRILPIGPNVEALIIALRSAGGAIHDVELQHIIAKSSRGQALTARDRVLNRHAHDESHRAIRAELMRRADAWRAIVELSATIVGAAVAPVG